MRLYTSYYGAMKKLPIENHTLISISATTPAWFNGRSFSMLAPSPVLVHKYKKGLINIEEYERACFAKLNNISDITILINLLASIIERDGNEGAIFFCYEKPGDFCHRHLLSKWLRTKGYQIREYKI